MLTLRLAPEPSSATRARAAARSHLAPVCSPAVVEAVALVVTELVANVVVHAETGMLLALDVDRDRIEVYVQDSSLGRPELREQDTTAIGRRGLAIVDELATEWGVQDQAGGKVVWARIANPGAPSASPRR